MKESQNSQILDFLWAGNKLTPLLALELFGCFRLAARINDLKRNGWPIITDIITTEKGKRVAQYSMRSEWFGQER